MGRARMLGAPGSSRRQTDATHEGLWRPRSCESAAQKARQIAQDIKSRVKSRAGAQYDGCIADEKRAFAKSLLVSRRMSPSTKPTYPPKRADSKTTVPARGSMISGPK